MINEKFLKALEGHPHRDAILETLGAPVEPYECDDYREGYIVQAPYSMDDACPCEGQATVHRLPHWKGGCDPEGLLAHIRRQKEKRALHGLEFMEKPHRNGRYTKAGPSNRAKVKEAYLRQHRAEWG